MGKKSPKRYPRLLPVPISDGELVKHGSTANEFWVEIQRLEEEKKAAASAFKSKLKEAWLGFTKEQAIIHDRAEIREVMCVDEIDPGSLKVTVIRLDTGQVVDDRDLNGGDLQTDLPLDSEDEED